MAVEERFDRHKMQYLKDETGRYYVPVTIVEGVPTPVMPMLEVFKTETDESGQ